MSMFDVDQCRGCGTDVEHQEDYCESCVESIRAQVERYSPSPNKHLKFIWWAMLIVVAIAGYVYLIFNLVRWASGS